MIGDTLQIFFLACLVNQAGNETALALACRAGDSEIAARLLQLSDLPTNLIQLVHSSHKTAQTILQECLIIENHGSQSLLTFGSLLLLPQLCNTSGIMSQNHLAARAK